jgi:multidrug resistance protein
MSKQKAIILLTVFIDILGMGIVIPILPFYVTSFGATPFIVTLLFAVFSFFAFISAPFLGSLSDRIGRRPILMVSILSTAIGWFVFASAQSILFLFIGRIIDGLAAGNFSTAQSYLVDIAKSDEERTHNLGLVGSIFGIGFILGPAIGGLLSSISIATPFWFVGALALLNLILAYFILPETNLNLKKDKEMEFNPFLPIVRAVQNRPLLPSFYSWFFFGLAAVGMQSVFALYLNKTYGFGSLAVGIIMTATGVIIALNQGFALKRFWLKYFRESNLEFWFLLIFPIGIFLLSFNLFWLLLVGLLFTTFSQSLLRIVMTSQIVGSAHDQNRGEILGIVSSIASLGMIIGPLISGYLFEMHPNYPFFVSAFYCLVAFAIVFVSRKKIKQCELPDDVPCNTTI